jgi:hypothetical protein
MKLHVYEYLINLAQFKLSAVCSHIMDFFYLFYNYNINKSLKILNICHEDNLKWSSLITETENRLYIILQVYSPYFAELIKQGS